MSNRLYLTPEQLIELTDCHHVRTQQRALREAGYPFTMVNGRIKVLLSVVEALGGAKTNTAETGPNWAAWEEGTNGRETKEAA